MPELPTVELPVPQLQVKDMPLLRPHSSRLRLRPRYRLDRLAQLRQLHLRGGRPRVDRLQSQVCIVQVNTCYIVIPPLMTSIERSSYADCRYTQSSQYETNPDWIPLSRKD